MGLTLRPGTGRLSRIARRASFPLSPPLFLLAVVAASALAATLVWSLVDVPVLALAAAIGGAYAPVAWAGRWRERRLRERERAWPAALAQLADALEAGIAFPAAVGARRGARARPVTRRSFALPRARCARVGSRRRSRGSPRGASEPRTRSRFCFARRSSSFRREGSRPCCASSPGCSPSGSKRARRRARVLRPCSSRRRSSL